MILVNDDKQRMMFGMSNEIPSLVFICPVCGKAPLLRFDMQEKIWTCLFPCEHIHIQGIFTPCKIQINGELFSPAVDNPI